MKISPLVVIAAIALLSSGSRGQTLQCPPWPSKLWTPYDPFPNYVGVRAAALLPILWDLDARKIRKAYSQEKGDNGEWVTYVAQWHGPKMGVTAFALR